MTNFIKVAGKLAVASALLGAMSVASAGSGTSGTSGTSGSAGATIDTGGGGALAGSGAGSNPRLAQTGANGGPAGLLARVFDEALEKKRHKKGD